jgi:cellulose synthase/poly-beta-1,6-N-acetylglucosamine synthase-like glycosyltransferase
MDFWKIIYIIDWGFFIIVALTVLYLAVFTIAGMFSRHPNIPKSRHQNRFIVFIPSFHGANKTIETVMAVLGQSYPQRLFDVTVISDHEDEMTNFRLAQYPITLLTPNFENSSKARSLQFAVNNLPQFKIYDVVVVLDAGTLVDQEFLQEINDAYEVSGTKAIQAHRLSKNRDTAIAHMDAVFEEINNTIFRRGHITLGLSSSLSGSGNAFSFEWFKDNIYKIKSSAYTKEMEALLLRQHIFVDYFNDILVYDEKKRESKEFNDQRAHWASTQFYSLIKNIRFLPMAIFNRYYAWIDKLIQWMLIPRTIMMAIMVLMSIIMPFIYFTLAIKWWILFAFVMFIFALSTPDYLVDKNWNKSFAKAPSILISSLFSPTKMFKGSKNDKNKKIKKNK